MSVNFKDSDGVYGFVRNNIYRANARDLENPALMWAVSSHTADLVRRSYEGGDYEAGLELHRSVYLILSARLSAPWQQGKSNADHPIFSNILYTFNKAMTEDTRRRNAALLAALPCVEEFPTWVTRLTHSSASGVQHPLFDFLADQAQFHQLHEFLLQETPFDIYFGDLVALMVVGVWGPWKVEILKNFWDEMGHGLSPRMHRNLRLRMMKSLGIAQDAHLKEVDRFRLSELKLANAYLLSGLHRDRLPNLIGMMLATELAVPGRLERQIEGWRRVGVADEDMEYLIEHTVVDVEHAEGWMQRVVEPLLAQSPELMTDIVIGVLDRLSLATEVCDDMLGYLVGLHLPLDVPASSEEARHAS